jgi:integrase
MHNVPLETERGPQERSLMTRRKTYQKGSVEIHNGQWSVRFREYNHVTRKWEWKRVGLGQHKGKKSAQKAAEPILSKVNEKNNATSLRALNQQMTFQAFIEKRWSAYTVSAKHRQSTIDGHNTLIKNHLMPWFGNMSLTDISPGDVSDFLDSRRTMLAPNTVLGVYSLLRLMFEIAYQYELISQSPIRSLMHRPEPVEVDKPTLTPEQMRALIAVLPEDDRPYFILLAVTGIRMNEGLALRWCDFDGQTITINHSLYRGNLNPPKTKSSRGGFRLHPVVAKMLNERREASLYQTPADFIFTRPGGLPASKTTMRRHLYKAMDKVGIEREPHKHGLHIFRHSAGTLLYDKVRDLKQVQSVLRHSDIGTTADIYVHADAHIVTEGTDFLAETILGIFPANRDLPLTQESEMVS